MDIFEWVGNRSPTPAILMNRCGKAPTRPVRKKIAQHRRAARDTLYVYRRIVTWPRSTIEPLNMTAADAAGCTMRLPIAPPVSP